MVLIESEQTGWVYILRTRLFYLSIWAVLPICSEKHYILN